MVYEYKTLEVGGHGATYHETDGFTVYGHSTYDRSSVLAGQPMRCWLGHYDTKEAALAEHPDAEQSGNSFQPVNLSRPSWCTPEYEAETGERWEDD